MKRVVLALLAVLLLAPSLDVYKRQALTSVAGSAVVIGKKKEF